MGPAALLLLSALGAAPKPSAAEANAVWLRYREAALARKPAEGRAVVDTRPSGAEALSDAHLRFLACVHDFAREGARKWPAEARTFDVYLEAFGFADPAPAAIKVTESRNGLTLSRGPFLVHLVRVGKEWKLDLATLHNLRSPEDARARALEWTGLTEGCERERKRVAAGQVQSAAEAKAAMTRSFAGP